MGSKGPIAIFFVGILGMVALGALAKLLVEESPVAGAMVVFREELAEQYPGREVEIVGRGEVYQVTVVGLDPRGVDFDEEASRLGHSLVQSGAFGRRPDTVEFVTRTPGGGCTAPVETGRGSYSFQTELRALRDELRKFVGKGGENLDFIVWQSTELQVRRVPKGLSKEQLDHIAKKSGTLWGGGWNEIRIVDGRRAYRYTGDGTERLGR